MNQFTERLGIEYPIIGGPMYPCSNPELVAAVSAAGGIGVVQPLSLTYVHGYDYAKGLDYIHSLTDRPVGFNALIEKSSRKYRQRMANWIDISLDHGIRFFITSLGKPDWVVQRVHKYGGLVYHDVTEHKWARIGVDCGVDGLICVNRRAGGHAGGLSAEALYEQCLEFQKPLVCAGGIATPDHVRDMLDLGYQACQLGTRFIASDECRVSDAYKQAIIDASEQDIVLSQRLTGVPVSIIRPRQNGAEQLEVTGLLARMLQSPRFKHLARLWLTIRSAIRLKRAIRSSTEKSEYWQAGKSAGAIDGVLPVGEIVRRLVAKQPT
jgi:nitronate monooxygenase